MHQNKTVSKDNKLRRKERQGRKMEVKEKEHDERPPPFIYFISTLPVGFVTWYVLGPHRDFRFLGFATPKMWTLGNQALIQICKTAAKPFLDQNLVWYSPLTNHKVKLNVLKFSKHEKVIQKVVVMTKSSVHPFKDSLWLNPMQSHKLLGWLCMNLFLWSF